MIDSTIDYIIFFIFLFSVFFYFLDYYRLKRRIKKHSAEIGMKLNKRPCYKICDIVV